MKRWALVITAVIWLCLGVFISWVNGLAAHGGEGHESPGVTEESAPSSH